MTARRPTKKARRRRGGKEESPGEHESLDRPRPWPSPGPKCKYDHLRVANGTSHFFALIRQMQEHEKKLQCVAHFLATMCMHTQLNNANGRRFYIAPLAVWTFTKTHLRNHTKTGQV